MVVVACRVRGCLLAWLKEAAQRFGVQLAFVNSEVLLPTYVTLVS
jgi:hypothetical protein